MDIGEYNFHYNTMSNWFLNAASDFQLYHGENKFYVDVL
jgi:hypothetical protein